MEQSYAIIATGGKQYRVCEGDILDVELLQREKEKIFISEVLLFHDGKKCYLGAPYLSNFRVEVEPVERVKGPKVIAYKYKRRKNYRRKVGHRQNYSRIKVVAFQRDQQEENELWLTKKDKDLQEMEGTPLPRD